MNRRLARSALLIIAASTVLGVAVAFSSSAGYMDGKFGRYGHTSAVGALFTISSSGQLQTHFCTGSVVYSPAGDLIVTAAHCMDGHSAGQVAFVPGYSQGREPFGTWTVKQVIEDQRWTSSRDPDDDFAFLIVGQGNSTVSVQALTGGEAIAVDVPAGRPVTVAGYPDGQNTPISCQSTVLAFSSSQYEFDCGGFTDGTSGSPLLADVGSSSGVNTVIGVIGGFQQGGSSPSVSYAAKFSTRLFALYQTAIAKSGR